MTVCIPVNEDMGLSSTVCPHFGSAPFFMLVDTETGNCSAITNQNQHHGHGMCMPLASLQGKNVHAMIVSGIGGGALNKLNASGVEVYISTQPTVESALDALNKGKLPLMQPNMACTQHQHNHTHQ